MHHKTYGVGNPVHLNISVGPFHLEGEGEGGGNIYYSCSSAPRCIQKIRGIQKKNDPHLVKIVIFEGEGAYRHLRIRIHSQILQPNSGRPRDQEKAQQKGCQA